jgi:PAS domain S-box-containing protein
MKTAEEQHDRRSAWRAPLMPVIVGAAVLVLVLLIVVLPARNAINPFAIVHPWVPPFANGFFILIGFCVAFLAFGRWQVLRDPASFWVGIAFSGFSVGMLFNFMTFPGLLPGGGSIIGHLLSTAAWAAVVAAMILSVTLLAAVQVPWPGEHAAHPARWQVPALLWLVFVTLMHVLFIVYEQDMPVLVGSTGWTTPLVALFAVGIGVIAAAGAALAARRYARGIDVLLGYVALFQIAVIGAAILAIAVVQRYDFWWFAQRILWVTAFLTIFFGLLSEYVTLFRREREKTWHLDLSAAELNAERARWKGVVEGIADELWIADSQGKMTLINLPEETAMRLGSFSNKSVMEVLKDVDIFNPDGRVRDPEQAPLLRSLKGEVVRGEEIMRHRKTGTTRYRQFSSAPMRDASGAITGSVAIVRDVTNLKLAEEALKQRTAELQRLTETLEERVKERTAELANLYSQLVSAQETERRRVSYDLHDNVWQTLDIIRAQIERLYSGDGQEDSAGFQEKSRELILLIRNTVARIRSMQGDLWPFVLDDIGILATIEWYCREFQANHPGLSIEKHFDPAEPDVPASIKIVIYRVMQEALANVAMHGRATHVSLSLIKGDHHLDFTVRDDGIGFNPEETMAKKGLWGGLGLMSMKQRTELAGGLFRIESAKDRGTTIRTSWPI